MFQFNLITQFSKFLLVVISPIFNIGVGNIGITYKNAAQIILSRSNQITLSSVIRDYCFSLWLFH